MSTRAELADAIATELANGRNVGQLLDSWLARVPAELFSDTGKWKYSVELDYRNAPGGYLAPHENARRALAQATDNKASGVVFGAVPLGWFMFVPEPPEGYPAMVIGGAV